MIWLGRSAKASIYLKIYLNISEFMCSYATIPAPECETTLCVSALPVLSQRVRSQDLL